LIVSLIIARDNKSFMNYKYGLDSNEDESKDVIAIDLEKYALIGGYIRS